MEVSIMRFLRMLLLLALSFSFITGCSNDDKSTSPGDSTTGTLKLLLTDAPGIFDEVNIAFSEISANFEDEWIIINEEEQSFDLLTLTNGVTSLLGEKKLDAGQYGQIRLKITEADVVVDGTSFTLDIPSSTKSGLKLGGGFVIEPAIETFLIIDFDASRSIHTIGHKEEYKMKPVIRLIAQAESGGITGIVTNPQDVPIAYAIADTDTVTSALVDVENGSFTLSFLPANTYTVAVTDTLGLTYSKPDVTVTVGDINELGDDTLE